MTKRRISIVVALSMVGYLVSRYFEGSLTLNASLIGKLIFVGFVVSGLVEAGIATWIVLTSQDSALGKLGDHRTGVTIGLVAGLIFAALTCLNELGVNGIEKPTTKIDQTITAR